MIDCLIMGDSIAVGTSRVPALHSCYTYAKGGINTHDFNRTYVNDHKNDFNAEVVILSLGTNDHKVVKTLIELQKTRAKIKAQRVYWIMPPCNDNFCKPHVNEWVKQVAETNGDFIIATKRLQADNIHPSTAGYKELAGQVK